MTTKEDAAELEALVERKARDLAMTDDERKVRSIIREEVSEALKAMFDFGAGEDEDEDKRKQEPKGTGSGLFDGLLGR